MPASKSTDSARRPSVDSSLPKIEKKKSNAVMHGYMGPK